MDIQSNKILCFHVASPYLVMQHDYSRIIIPSSFLFITDVAITVFMGINLNNPQTLDLLVRGAILRKIQFASVNVTNFLFHNFSYTAFASHVPPRFSPKS
jgi:hypothetical protein